MDDIERDCFEAITDRYLRARHLLPPPEAVEAIIFRAYELWTGEVMMGQAVTTAIDEWEST